MKVLWFSNTSANAVEHLKEGPVGGGWLKSLDKALQQKVELHIAFYFPKRNESFKYLDTTYHPISKGNWRLKAVLGLFWSRIVYQQDFLKYLNIINLVNPDIIHIHGTENPFGYIISKINIPVVVSIQGCMTVYHHKFLSGFTKKNLSVSIWHRGKGLKQFIRKKSFNRSLKEFEKKKTREQQNLKFTSYIIGRTAWDRRITSVLAPDRVYYHCDELLRDAFYKHIWEYNGGRKKLVIQTTNSNSPYKGFETICETLHILNTIKDIQIEWQVAGISSGDSIVRVTRNKLKHKFPESGLIYLGNLNENKLVELLCKAQIYVSPSHIENSPNSLCEAMILGLPCIATFAGGTGSLLKDGEEGILIQDGDPWALAGAIIELYNNPTLANQYGRNARERALKRHDPDKVVKSYIDVYNDIIKRYQI